MSHKIKVFLVFLALSAGLSVFAFMKSLDFEIPKLAEIKNSALSVIDNDLDNDGLDNREESYWNTDFQNADSDSDGFLDGEEIASGHDPLIPGPEDFLPSSANLTQKLSSLALAGMYEGSLRSGGENFDNSLNELALVIMDDAENNFNIDTANIELRLSLSDKSSQQFYVDQFSKTYDKLIRTFVEQMLNMESSLNKIGTQGFADKKVSENFKDRSYEYKKLLNEFANIAVPEVWEKSHLGVMEFTGSLMKSSEAISIGESDPVKATLALNKIIDLWYILPEMTKSYGDKIKNAGLSTSKTIFK